MENAEINLQPLKLTRKRTARGSLENHALAVMTAAMVASDLVGLGMAGLNAVLMRWTLLGPFRPDLIVWLAPLAVLMVMLFTMRKLYPGTGLGAVEEFRSLTINISLMFVITSALFLVLKQGAFVSRFAFVLFWMGSMVTIPALRRVTRHIMTEKGLWGEPVAIIGEGEEARKLYRRFRRDPKIGLKPVAVFTAGDEGVEDMGNVPVYGMEQIEEISRKDKLRMAAVLYEELDQVEGIVTRYRETFERLVMFNANGNHHYLNKVSIQHYGDLVSLQVHHRLLDPWAQAVKRVTDLVISGAALVVLFPFYMVAALLIYIDSPGRILYRQVRLGKGGKPFTLYKLRTMYMNADEVLKATLERDPVMKEEWEKYEKLKKDPRITRVGRLLRRFSIDELAQLWNVFRGEMSLVGPRPILPSQQMKYGDNYQHYVRVVPGISGLWQIRGRNQTFFSRRTELDMEYVISWSIWLDIYIMVRTVWVVLRREGAF